MSGEHVLAENDLTQFDFCFPCLPQDALMNLLKRSQIHFVHCLVPRLGMDGTECKSSQLCRGTAGDPINAAIDVPTVRIQLAGAQLLDAMRLCRIGKRLVYLLDNESCF